MTAMQRTKGASAERAVVTYLRQHGWPDARRYLAGDGRQPGDIDAIPGVSLEVKNCAKYDLAGWLKQAIAEAGPRLPIVIAKPPGITDVANWYTIMRFSDALTLLRSET